MWTNQKLSGSSIGRSMGAMPPEVALSSDCNASNRVPFTGSINNPQDRVRYYSSLMQAFTKQPAAARSGLMDTLSKGPGF